ncbi:MAG: hypothetical protein Q9168_000715 [Polycauliona sp. 1 TL-2023]
MGINGEYRPKPCHLKKFAGQTIGVDAYGWLHRGTVACAIDLALGKPTTKFVDYSMNRVRMLIHFGVTPYLVFDGDYLPSKAATELERATKREESKKRGLELHRLGKISQAHLELQKAVDVTPEMARQLIEELKVAGVQYVVAPYEADAQLAYLEQKGLIQGILSEDSDLLVFGAKRLLTKLEQYGDCIEINRSDFTSCREVSLARWTDAEFRQMAILSGCDYLASIHKMGLKTAYRLVRKHKKIEKILRMLQFDGHYHVPAGYLEAFHRAELTFLHQRVFCPETNSIVMMTPPGVDLHAHDLSFLGAEVDPELALGIVKGDIHPMTKKPIVLHHKNSQPRRSPWSSTQRQTIGTPSDLKANKPMDAFLKAQRTPLAELDPNSFTPSPSQRRLLLQQQQSGSWTSSPAPLRSTMARFNTSISKSDSASSTVRVALGMIPKSASASQPPKRRRLCSGPTDDEKPSGTDDTATERSPFFVSSVPNSNPLEKGCKKPKSCRTTSFNIYSDDSIEEAMAALSDMSQKQVDPRRSIGAIDQAIDHKVEPELSSTAVCLVDLQAISQCSTTSGSTVQSGLSVDTSATSLADEDTSQQAVARCLDTHIQGELASLRKKTLYQPEPERCRVQRLGIAKVSAPLAGKPSLRTEGGMTPLRRLGITALKRSYSCDSPPSRLTTSGEPPQTQGRSRRILSGRDMSGQSPPPDAMLNKEAGLVRGSEDAAPSGVRTEGGEPSATPKMTPRQEHTPVKGSEDAMIPDSEAESDERESDNGQERPGLDWGRFAFAG